jgi:putative addiction module killer protein
MNIEVFRYCQDDGHAPFTAWLASLRDMHAQTTIRLRLRNVQKGSLGDFAPVGEGVCELRIHTGPGYRIYFGWATPTAIILLCGGSKSQQAADIKYAKTLLHQWKQRQI